jgi:hypothetical protein
LGNQTIILKYGHRPLDFSIKYFRFSKMDKKNVQKRKSQKTFPTKKPTFIYTM